MRKFILSFLLTTLLASAYAQNLRIRSTDETSNPEIDNLSGYKPDGSQLEGGNGPVHGINQDNGLLPATVSENASGSGDITGKSGNTQTERNPVVKKIYTNPASDYVIVSLDGSYTGTIRILNLLGQEVMNTQISGNDTRIDLSSLKEGIYFVSIESGAEKIVKKIKVTN